MILINQFQLILIIIVLLLIQNKIKIVITSKRIHGFVSDSDTTEGKLQNLKQNMQQIKQ